MSLKVTQCIVFFLIVAMKRGEGSVTSGCVLESASQCREGKTLLLRVWRKLDGQRKEEKGFYLMGEWSLR